MMDLGLLDSRLQVFDNKIKSLEESAQALRLHRNSLLSISRLPPELLSIIFSFLHSSWVLESSLPNEQFPISHVCHRWREISLNKPSLWSHINFADLTPTGTAEMLARAKAGPLHLKAPTIEWGGAKFDAFQGHIESHIHRTSHLGIMAVPGRLKRMFRQLVSSSAPSLQKLSFSSRCIPPLVPNNLFGGIPPKLTHLRLDHCRISWRSPLLKGLRDLELSQSLSRAPLNVWLDALNQMPQLERLALHDSFPIPFTTPLPLPGVVGRTIVLSSLTELAISDIQWHCTLILAHLVLPALTKLRVNTGLCSLSSISMQGLIPYVARNGHGPQDTEVLQSVCIGSRKWQAEIVAWTLPRQDTEDRDWIRSPVHYGLDPDDWANAMHWKDADSWLRSSVDLRDRIRPARVEFSITGKSNFAMEHPEMGVQLLLTALPLDSITSLTDKSCTQLSREVWRCNASRWHKLERVRLCSTAVPGFREMLDYAMALGDPQPPSLEELILSNISLNAQKVYYLCDMLIECVELGIPLRTLDLRTCTATNREVQLLSEIVVDVRGPVKKELGDLNRRRRGSACVLGEEGGSDEEDEGESAFDDVPNFVGSWDEDTIFGHGDVNNSDDEDDEDVGKNNWNIDFD